MRPLIRALMIVLLTVPANCATAARIDLPISEQGPKLQGDLSDPLWAEAPLLDDFVALNSFEPAQVPTEARVIVTREYLYIGFVCHEPHMDALVTAINEHDDAVWTDDCVEVMVDPANGKARSYHWAINSRGTVWDGMHTTGGGTMIGFDSTAAVRTARADDRWSVEVAIPLAEIGGAPTPGETWGFNVGRERKADEPQVSSWAPSNGFVDPSQLGEVHFTPEPGPVTLEIVSRGGGAAQFNETGHNVFCVLATNADPQPIALRLMVEAGGAEIGAAAAEVPSGESVRVVARYEVPTDAQGQVRFTVMSGDRRLYRSSVELLTEQARPARTWIVEEPLFAELFSDEPPGLARDGVLMWTHTLNTGLMRETARRFAVRYVVDEIYRDYGEHGLIAIRSGGRVSEDRAETFARYNLKIAGYLGGLPEGVPWALDPRAIDHYLSQVETLLSEPHPHLWCIYAGDELDEVAMQQGAELMADPPEDYPFILEADAEVREQYGGGQWGIPLGREDKNPYRWIAYQRWALARLNERHRRLHETVQRLDPNVHIVSTDPVGGIHGRQFSRQAPYFDIFTHQYLPRQSRWRQYLGFLTKVLADLTGKEVWPCAHIENYAFATRPEEVVEELSQVFRNGGHGLHLYMPDCANGNKLVGDTRATYFGSPRRHHTVMNIIDLIREMPRLRYPDYDRTAIVYNDDSLQSGFRDDRTHWYFTEACYTFLGPIAGSWFRFIDPEQIIEWPSLRERFDLIYLPTARYQRPEVVAKLREFVVAGGTLICGDPTAFETDTIGTDTTAARTELFGVQVGEGLNVARLLVSLNGRDFDLAAPPGVRALTPVADVEVLGRFEDGSPAITRHALGAGAALLFAGNPFVFRATEDPAWQEFFTTWTAAQGAPVGLDIWRFRFPDSVIWEEPPLQGYCLTANYVLWQEETPHFPRNLEIGATYSYSLAPDGVPDVAEGEISVAEGKLTDRRSSIYAEKSKPEWYAPYALPAGTWQVEFERLDPFSITFDLKQPWHLRQAKLWVSGSMPTVLAEVSADGRQWSTAGSVASLEAGEDVHDVTIALDAPGAARYVRLNFAARAEEQRLTIVEAEVWGDSL